MRDPNFDAHGAVNQPGLSGLYQQSDTRLNWDNPSPREVAKSLNHAHLVNRTLVRTLSRTEKELYDTRQELQAVKSEFSKEIAEAKAEAEAANRRVWYYKFKSAVLTAVLGAAAYSGIKVIAAAVLSHFLR